ncbi:MAG: hypothetical protein KC432_02530 [Thermomicrobiales bacterium]|nr:hypothetical protein [Thermomicrobiales bacterium]
METASPPDGPGGGARRQAPGALSLASLGMNLVGSPGVCALLANGAANAIVLAGAGSGAPMSSVTLTFDDAASAPPGQGAIASGRYQPFSYVPANSLSSVFVAPAPVLSGSTALSAFRDLDPDGAWRLFIVDTADGDTGSLDGGWELTADVPNP